MDRAFSSGASGTPPSAPASPSSGYATSGNPGTGTPATKPGAWWYHMVTEELRQLIVAAGLTPDYTNTSQVAQAVQALIAAGAANDYKASVRAATTANITTLAGGAPQTLDGVTLVAANRILVKDQTTGSQNGIYYVATLGTGANGTWTRATDADGAGELAGGAIVAVEEGTTNADSQWMLTTDGAITIGTTSLTFVRQGGSSSQKIQSITASVAAGALTFTLNPTSLDFRSATLSSGTVNTRTVSSAISIVVPSTATLGTVSLVQGRIAVLAIDNAGTVELAVVNAVGGNDLSETGLINTTAISAAANSASVIYSTTARTGVPYRVVGYIESTQATAGTWVTAPSTVQGAGGLAGNSPVQSVVRVATANGFGSTNTAIRRFSTVITNIGPDISYSDSATAGALFTINRNGLYAISHSDSFASGSGFFGVSLNTTQFTTGIQSVNTADILAICAVPNANAPQCAAATLFLKAGDAIRPHTGTSNVGGTGVTLFTISRIG